MSLFDNETSLAHNKRNPFDSDKKTKRDLFQVFTCVLTTAVQLHVNEQLIDQLEKSIHFKQLILLYLQPPAKKKAGFQLPSFRCWKRDKKRDAVAVGGVQSSPICPAHDPTLRVYVGAMLTRTSTVRPPTERLVVTKLGEVHIS